ncbi:MAG: hypothetical protein ABI471_00115 [Sphingomonas bacterium]
MLVTIYQGASLEDAKSLGDMHFESRPGEGDHLEIQHAFHVVQKAWHMPNVQFAGAKFAVLVSAPLASGRNIPEAANESASGPVPLVRSA